MNDFKRKVGAFFGSDGCASTTVSALLICVVMVFNAMLFTATELFDWGFSYRTKIDYSLSGNTDELFEEAISEGKKVKISFCMAEDDLKVHTTGGEVYITVKNFAERYPDFIELDYINIITRRDKDGNLVNLSKYQTPMSEDTPEGEEPVKTPIYKTSVIFECGDNYRVLTDGTSTGFAYFYNLDSNRNIIAYNGEEVTASMVSWVIADEHKKAYVTTRHGEQADPTFFNMLSSAGYVIGEVDLRSSKVPDDADLLIISNPKSDFEAARPGSNIHAEIDRLRAYAERGGNIFVSLDPYVKKLSVLEGFLSEYGIKFSSTDNGNGSSTRNIVKDLRNAITADGFTFVADYADSPLADSVSDKAERYGDGKVLLKLVSALELSKDAKPLLVSSSSSELESNGKTVSSSGSYVIAAYSETETDSGKSSRIFVIPTIYAAVSDALTSHNYSNKDFLYALFEDFYGAEGMPYGCKPIFYDSQILENLTMGTAGVYTAIIMLIPVAIAAVGTVVLVRRKNR